MRHQTKEMSTATKFVDARTFRDAARRGEAAGLGVRASAFVHKLLNDASRIVPWVLSDGGVDRQLDTINVDGWETTAFGRNNVCLWAHDASILPIGRVHNVRSDGTRLLGDVEFAPPEVNEFADQVFRMVKAGFLRAGSVGFIPVQYTFNQKRGGIDFHRQSLLEFSITPLPANENALALRMAKSMGIKTNLLRHPPRKAREPMSPRQREQHAAQILLEVAERELREASTYEEYEKAKSRQLRAKRTLGMLDSGNWQT
jgi:HK97 family phage prohead protease